MCSQLRVVEGNWAPTLRSLEKIENKDFRMNKCHDLFSSFHNRYNEIKKMTLFWATEFER
jgi:hypothetical protein